MRRILILHFGDILSFVFPTVVVLGARAVGVSGHLNAIGIGSVTTIEKVPTSLVDTIIANGCEGVRIQDRGIEVVVNIRDVDQFGARSHAIDSPCGFATARQVRESRQESVGHTLSGDIGGTLRTVAIVAIKGTARKGNQVAVTRNQTTIQPVGGRDGSAAVGDEVQHGTGDIGYAVAIHVAIGNHVVIGGCQGGGIGRIGTR